MKIKKQCSLASTTSKNKYVQSIVGKCGELNLETGQYMVFHIPMKDGRVLQMKTGPMKTIGVVGNRIHTKTVAGTNYMFIAD